MTSHDAVFKLRKLLHEKKIGHGGTLDPDVVGVLPIAVGKATRVIEYMTEAGKVYRGQICLGFSTTTEDASGEVVERTPVSADLSPEQVDEAMAGMVGDINQTPPMYSAVKVNGRRLYEYARAGEEVERPHRQVSIYDFRRTSSLTFKDDCCYFDFDDALTLAEIAEKCQVDDWSFLLPIEYGVMDLPRVDLTDEEAKELSFGRKIPLERTDSRLAGFYQDKLIAILEPREDLYKPRKVFM